MTEWDELSPDVLDTMKSLGGFRPTVRVADRQIKGVCHDDEGECKWYLGADDLRAMAGHFVAVADWLDARAAE